MSQPINPSSRIAVIGAGLTGLLCAQRLAEHHEHITIFDKGRGPGGRTSTRRHRLDNGLVQAFDHGCQYIIARDQQFAAQVRTWTEAGVLSEWQAELFVGTDEQATANSGGRPKYVGNGAMHALARHLAESLPDSVDTVSNTRVERVEHSTAGWTLHAENDPNGDNDQASFGPFSHVVVAIPAPQAETLVNAIGPQAADIAAAIARVEMAPCWAAMFAFDEPTPYQADGFYARSEPIAFAVKDSTKPGHTLADGHAETWVVQMSETWSIENVELEREEAVARIRAELLSTLGNGTPEPVLAAAHRWRFARATRPLNKPCLHDAKLCLTVCGDWCLGTNIEAAWLSAQAAAEAVLGQTRAHA